MKILNIAAALGWSEIPDAEESLHLQPEEVRKIEKDLAAANVASRAAANVASRAAANVASKAAANVASKAAADVASRATAGQATPNKGNTTINTTRASRPVDYGFIDSVTGAIKKANEDKNN